jgi:hypothetical protein
MLMVSVALWDRRKMMVERAWMNERVRRGSVKVAALLAASTLSAQAKPEPEKAVAPISLTGCLVRAGAEAGAAGSGIPVRGDGGYVLQVSPGGEAAASVEARAAKPTGDAARQPRAYRLVPADPSTDFSTQTGRLVEVTGRVPPNSSADAPRSDPGVADARPPNQRPTPTGDPAVASAKGATVDANQTRPNALNHPTLVVTSLRIVGATCASDGR